MIHLILFGEKSVISVAKVSHSALKQLVSLAEVGTVITEAYQVDYMKLIRTYRAYTLF
ncbi:hypothetical protein [Acinetobacter baumannii]|uniref:hypothetical protein n=1 Tax=Acinetobacter baumannii TaxID=470 RepID=UPI000810795D